MVHIVGSAAEWAELKRTKKALIVDFTASWCGPCQVIGPIFEKLSAEYTNVFCVKIDVDALNDVAAECGVRAMPTFQAFLNGEKVDELTGADPNRLQRMMASLNDKASVMMGPGQKVGGASSGAADPSPGSDGMRARLAAAAEARMKAMGQ